MLTRFLHFSKKEGEELVKEMKGRFSATVTGTNALEGNEELALCFVSETFALTIH